MTDSITINAVSHFENKNNSRNKTSWLTYIFMYIYIQTLKEGKMNHNRIIWILIHSYFFALIILLKMVQKLAHCYNIFFY